MIAAACLLLRITQERRLPKRSGAGPVKYCKINWYTLRARFMREHQLGGSPHKKSDSSHHCCRLSLRSSPLSVMVLRTAEAQWADPPSLELMEAGSDSGESLAHCLPHNQLKHQRSARKAEFSTS